MRRTLLISAILTALAAWWLWPRSEVAAELPGPSSRAKREEPAQPPVGGASGPGWSEEDFPLAGMLNAPGSTIGRDLDLLVQMLDAWRSNFPHDGNPVGGNAEIAAALAGANRLELVLIPRSHPAFNAAGELCDRWGTPFRFHPLSGERMEIRSAGPDRRFATEDDAQWAP